MLGFPANDFAGQEPGTNEEIAEFCAATYGVQFPMFAKIVVTGEDKHPLYAELTSAVPEAEGDHSRRRAHHHRHRPRTRIGANGPATHRGERLRKLGIRGPSTTSIPMI